MIHEIWCEGDEAHHYTACHLGYGKGSTIVEACDDLASKNDYFSRHYNRKKLTYWGTRLFISEKLAREKFG